MSSPVPVSAIFASGDAGVPVITNGAGCNLTSQGDRVRNLRIVVSGYIP
jgi:hypothetical protein